MIHTILPIHIRCIGKIVTGSRPLRTENILAIMLATKMHLNTPKTSIAGTARSTAANAAVVPISTMMRRN